MAATPSNVAPIRHRTRAAAPVRSRRLTDLTGQWTEPNQQVLTLKEYVGQQQLIDPFKSYYGGTNGGAADFQVIEPPYSFAALLRLPDENAMLKQCIAAMVTNIEGHGYRLEYIGPEGQEETPAVLAEKQDIDNLLSFPNDDTTFQEMRSRRRTDYETLGVSYFEIGRDRQGRVTMISHVPGHSVRATSRDEEATEVEVPLPRDGKQTTTIRKRFRRYVQIVGNRRVYFKEFGDPRKINPKTGKEQANLSWANSATEIYAFNLYAPGSPYGLPRWFNQLPSVMGMRQAELTNLDFFKENAIPAMVLMVAGGLLTEESLLAIETHFTNARGRAAMNRIAVIEVGGDPANAPENGAMPVPKVEMRPLQAERQGDALFQDYEQNCADKIRSAFRLPPIYVGLAQDLTYATAKTSFEVAESQVFGPERTQFDDFMNKRILTTLKAKFWRFRSLPPRLANREDVIEALAVFERIGALTPNVTIQLANEFFDLAIKPVSEPWGDYPFSLITTMVQTAQLKGEAFTALAEHIQEPSSGRPEGPGGQPAAPAKADETADVRQALLLLRQRLQERRRGG